MAGKYIEELESRRFFAAYAPDVSFGRDGLVPTEAGQDRSLPSVTVVRSDGHGVLVAVLADKRGQTHLRLERYTVDGRPDPTFTPRDLPYRPTTYENAFSDRHGRVLVISNNYITHEAQVTRYTAAGTLDTAFGNGGSVTLPVLGTSNVYDVYSFHLTDSPDGSIYVSSLTRDSGPSYDAHRNLYKLTPAGRPDTGFGKNGVVNAGNTDTNVVDLVSADNSDGFSFTTDAQGRLLIGVAVTFGEFRFTRYLSDGQTDTSYGTKGSYAAPTHAYSDYVKYRAAFDSQGRALLLTTEQQSTLTRLTVNGRVDAGFGTNGVVTRPGVGAALIVQNNDKVVLELTTGLNDDDVGFVRLRTDGTPDPAFGDNGVADYLQTNRAADPQSLDELLGARLITLTADGDYLVAVGTAGGTTVEKIAPAQAARRGTSGRLYLLGDGGSDQAVVTRNQSGVTHVVINGRAYDFSKHITGVYANLGGGANRLDSRINVPQNVVTGKGNDTITTGDGNDSIFSSEGIDTITANGGYDQISFRGGNKLVDAGPGSGSVTGGGRSRNGYSGSGPLAKIRITGPSTDGATEGGWKVDVRGTRVSVTLGGGSAKIAVDAVQTAYVNVTDVTSRISTAINAKRVAFTTSQAATRGTITAGLGSDIFLGSGDDVLTTGRGNDTIYGNAGNDRIYGQGGNDWLIGGGGNDILVGGTGDDTLLGQAGNDRLYAGDAGGRRVRTARNLIDGGRGTDRYLEESDLDVLDGVEKPIARGV